MHACVYGTEAPIQSPPCNKHASVEQSEVHSSVLRSIQACLFIKHIVPQYLRWPQIVSCLSSNRCTKVDAQPASKLAGLVINCMSLIDPHGAVINNEHASKKEHALFASNCLLNLSKLLRPLNYKAIVGSTDGIDSYRAHTSMLLCMHVQLICAVYT